MSDLFFLSLPSELRYWRGQSLTIRKIDVSVCSFRVNLSSNAYKIIYNSYMKKVFFFYNLGHQRVRSSLSLKLPNKIRQEFHSQVDNVIEIN